MAKDTGDDLPSLDQVMSAEPTSESEDFPAANNASPTEAPISMDFGQMAAMVGKSGSAAEQLDAEVSEEESSEEKSQTGKAKVDDFDLSGFGVDSSADDIPPMEPQSIPKVESKDSEENDEFSQSREAFAEIRSFGEDLMPGAAPEEAPKSVESEEKTIPPVAPEISPSVGTVTANGNADKISITAGSLLEGHKIVEYFPPISLSVAMDAEAEDPLANVFVKLRQKATVHPANAIVDFKWQMAGDGKLILATATPVKVEKKPA